MAITTSQNVTQTVAPQFLIVHLSSLGRVVLIVCLVMILSTVARVVWHGPLRRIAYWIPESGLLVSLGLLFGLVFHYSGSVDVYEVEGIGDVFFELLLPLIILPAGYFLDSRVFLYGFKLVLILLHALLGTIISSISIGLLVWVASPLFLTPIPVLHALTYGSLLSATDPVAVLAVFEAAHVNPKVFNSYTHNQLSNHSLSHYQLFNLVAGEATLNDAVGITLYGFFLQLSDLYPDPNSFPAVAAGWAVLQFLVISLGGLVFGLCGGAIASLISRWSGVLGVLEPIMVVVTSMIVFVLADWLGISGGWLVGWLLVWLVVVVWL
jgi:NhaP-type Na+/H+ or K+/H+ antiporter